MFYLSNPPGIDEGMQRRMAEHKVCPVSLEKGAKAAVAIPMTALYPLLTVVLATVFLRERPTLHEWVGIALALAGGAMLSYETAGATGNAQEKQ